MSTNPPKFPDFTFTEGEMLLINKPLTWTSFDVVGKIRNTLKPLKLKVGHAGTLDPLATGLLIICTGKLTKKIDEFQAQEKEYTGTFYIGATTPSYDLETEIDKNFTISHIDEPLIHETVKHFLGEINQKPPIYSAIKKDGVRRYEHARAGEVIEIE
jgi:tRNA pseudouridine55 synthase